MSDAMGRLPLTVERVREPAPPGWRWVDLRLVARLESGHTPSRLRPDWWKGSIPWIALPDIRALDGKVVTETIECTNEAGIANSAARVLPAGTVVLSRTASVGFVTIMGRAMATSQDFANWVCGPELDPEFLLHLLRAARPTILQLASGAIHKTVYMPTLKAFTICIPSVTEQRRIAAVLREKLSEIERGRSALAAQLAAAEALSISFIRTAFENDETESWPRRRLTEAIATHSGTTPSRSRPDYFGGGIPWIKTGELRDNEIIASEESVTEKAVQETSLRLLPEGTLLIAMYGQGQTRGRTALLRCPATINQACFALLPSPAFEPAFLQFYFRSRYHALRKESANRGGNQANLNGMVLRQHRIPSPDISTQRRIAAELKEKLATAVELRRALEVQSANLDRLSSAFLREAFDGRL